ncbi:MAG: MATE family efflux transporter [Roseateles sp.]|uniref:MATE family efflux transporter n=1 Tax=Roseateles sp. TaxID=1971397 RepID=UPI0039E8FB41
MTANATAPTPPTTGKTLLQLCLPLFLNGFLALGVALIDQFIISSYSDDAAAAISVANQVLGIVYDLSGLLAVGGVIVVARRLGAGDEAQARQTAQVAIVANSLLSVLLALGLLAAGHRVLPLIGTPPQIVGDATLYIRVIAIAMVFNGMLTAAVGVLRAFGHVKVILLLGVLANLLYVFLEFSLMHGLGPIPSLGVYGSALATLIVRGVGVALLLWVLARRLRLAWRSGLDRGAWLARVRQLTALSGPSVLDNMAYGFYQLAIVSFITVLGVGAVLSRSYTLTLTAFLSLLTLTISQGNEVMVGWRLGAGDPQAARRRAWRSAAIAMALSFAVALLLWLAAGPLIGLLTPKAEIHATARQLLLLTLLLAPIGALNTVLFNSLKAAGDVNAPVLASQLVTWAVALPLAYLFSRTLGLGVPGLWWAFIIEESLKAAYMALRWRSSAWERRGPMG